MRYFHTRHAGSNSPGSRRVLSRESSGHVLFFGAQGLLIVLLMLVGNLGSASAAPARQNSFGTWTDAGQMPVNRDAVQLRHFIQEGLLARTVHVPDSLPPTLIEQFPLVPSGLKAAFPQASGLVTIVRGDRDDSTSDTVTVDVQNMPPNITFTIFFIQFAGKPFGDVEYVSDLTTRGDGSGEAVFQCIAFVAFAMDARNPGISTDKREGPTSGTNLEHLGMWFSSLQDAVNVLHNDSLQGTIFDGGSPPFHAGPQAMTDGQLAPVF